MESKTVVFLDTSVLIDYFRKTQKENTFLVKLSDTNNTFAVSVITKFEIYLGCTLAQKEFWDTVFQNFSILPITETVIDKAVSIQKKLKQERQQIDFADLLIAATAIHYDLPIATINVKHFIRIRDLRLITQ
jgi:predicted nucleic acid-binding protein